jgi:diadenosine tetraphosphatase ApaH/serine/threonine PP2A family protein phosphatase
VRTLILSDLHANIHALDAVLADARRRGYDRAVCLGDLVGYGAHPNEVIDRVRELSPWRQVRGNHDKAACGVTDGGAFNEAAHDAILWTREVLTPENRDYLLGLPEGPLEAAGLLLSHGSPLDEEDYILGDPDAQEVMAGRTDPVMLFGHTHFAGVFLALPGHPLRPVAMGRGGSLRVPPGARALFNPGSIGQPRDHDPRACYAFHDEADGSFDVVRVAYDVDGARQAIAAAGLPAVLERRLALGI